MEFGHDRFGHFSWHSGIERLPMLNDPVVAEVDEKGPDAIALDQIGPFGVEVSLHLRVERSDNFGAFAAVPINALDSSPVLAKSVSPQTLLIPTVKPPRSSISSSKDDGNFHVGR